MHNRGQSEVVGVILLVGVIVVLTLTVGAFLLYGSGLADDSDDPQLQITVDVTSENVTLTHAGGTSLNASALDVVLGSGTNERRFAMSRANLSTGDWRYEAGVSLQRQHGFTGEELQVVVVERQSGTVLLDTTEQIPVDRSPSSLGPVSWKNESDWDATDQTARVVHDDYGTHNASAIELGYPRLGALGFWPLDDTAADVSGNNNDGTPVGPDPNVDGIVNTSSFGFDSSDYVEIPANDSLDSIADESFTISGWVQTTASDTAHLWSQFDGFGPGNESSDVVFGTRNGRLASLVGSDAVLSRNETADTDPEFNEGRFENTTLRAGNVELERDRDVTYGQLPAPREPGTERLELGFDPDLVVFRTNVLDEDFGETAEVGGLGLGAGTGFVDCTGGSCTEHARSFATGSSSPNGQSTVAANQSLHQAVTNADGATLLGNVSATVTDTNETGLTLEFEEVVDVGPAVQITYRAYTFDDAASVDVGTFRTPSAGGPNATATQEVDTGFQPNSVRLVGGPQATTPSDLQDENGAEFGWSQGWAVDNESKDVSPRSIPVGETGNFTTPMENVTLGETGTVTTPFQTSTPTVYGESGTVTTANGTWQNVSFTQSYNTPVVVGSTNTYNDSSAALTFDARNVTSDSAEIRVCETDGEVSDGCETHGEETVGYVVVDAANASGVSGVQAGTVTREDGIGDAQPVSYGVSFSSNPVVLANVQTTDGEQPVEARVTGRDTTSATIGICHQGSLDNCDGTHDPETVGWVAIDPTNLPFDANSEADTTGDSVGNSQWTGVDFSSFNDPPVVVASTLTNDGSQNVKIDEVKEVNAGGADVRYCEVETGDNCDTHTTENIGWFAIEDNATLSTTEGGAVWTNVSFENNYTDPIVVGTTNTDNGGAARTFDVRNVTNTSAEMRVCEFDGTTPQRCDNRVEETAGYMVIDAANLSSFDSIDAGRLDEGGSFSDDNTTGVNYDASFTSQPVVLANVQTTRGAQPVETRIKNRGSGGFTVGICHQNSEDTCNDSHVEETIGWVAIDSSRVPFDQQVETGETQAVVGSSEWETQSFAGSFTDPVVVASTMTENGGQEIKVDEARNLTTGGVEVRYCELDAGDSCDGHNEENVGWLAAENGTLTATISRGSWQNVSFERSYEEPVVVGTANTHDGGSALTFDARNVTNTSAELRACEIDGTRDGCGNHLVPETVGYLVVDAANASRVEGVDAGKVQVDGSFSNDVERTFYDPDAAFRDAPVVLANVQTTEGDQPVETRVTGRTVNRFDVGLCHHESLDGCGDHGQETVGWVAINRTDPFEESVAVDETGPVVGSSQWESQSIDESFDDPPAVVASTMTNNGGQEVKVDEVRNVTTGGVEVRYCELETGDTCDTHADENVGWVASAPNTTLSVLKTPRHDQRVLATSAYANNIDDHVYAASDERILNTLWSKKGGIDGRVHAYLQSFDTDGFTLDYTQNTPDSPDDRFLLTYLAVNSTVEPELGHGRTPTSSGTRTYNTSTPVTDVSLFGTNHIPEVGVEGYSGSNNADNHLGWLTGGGKINETSGQSMGFSSHSNSVNAHAVASDRGAPFRLLYTDQNGNILGSDVAAFQRTAGESFTLDWSEVATTNTSNVAFDRSVFVWHSYGGEMGLDPTGTYDRTVEAGQPVYWGRTDVTETVPLAADRGIRFSADGGSTWYDSLDSVPKSDSLTYELNLSSSDGIATPSVSAIQTEYRNYALTPLWLTEDDTDWDEGSFDDTTAFRETLALSRGDIGEAGRVNTSDGQWQTVEFVQSYDDPVVVGATNTHDGESALTFDARNVETDSAEVRVCETDGDSTDGCETHGEETVGYVVIDAAAVDEFEDIDAGHLRQGGSSRGGDTVDVSYDESFGDAPVVLANVQSTDGNLPVETRIKSRNDSAFTVGLCQQSGGDNCVSNRAEEEIGWVAIESGADIFDQSYEVGETGPVVGDSDWESQSFGASFGEQPVVVASTMTNNGGQEVKIDEARNVSTGGVEVRYCEMDSGDGCDSHNQENVGWLAVEPGPLRYTESGSYERTLSLDRVVDWQESRVGNTTPAGTDVSISYEVDNTTYSSLGSVPDSSNLTYTLSLSGDGEVTPVVERVNVSYDANTWRNGTERIDDGNWHHVAATYNGSALDLYVDGQRDKSYNFTTEVTASEAPRTLGGEPRESSSLDGRLDAVRLFDSVRDSATIADAANITRDGYLVTRVGSFEAAIDPQDLELSNVTATIPTDTNISVTVESDPDVDGNFEETSQPIQLDGSGEYSVPGMNVDSRVFRLRIELETDDATAGPSFGGAELTLES